MIDWGVHLNIRGLFATDDCRGQFQCRRGVRLLPVNLTGGCVWIEWLKIFWDPWVAPCGSAEHLKLDHPLECWVCHRRQIPAAPRARGVNFVDDTAGAGVGLMSL